MNSSHNPREPRIISCSLLEEKDSPDGTLKEINPSSNEANDKYKYRHDERAEGNDQKYQPNEESRKVAIKNAGERLYALGVANDRLKEVRLESLREQKLIKELSEVCTKPHITPRARWKPAKGCMFPEHSDEWKRKKEEHIEAKAEVIQNEREKELTLSPTINQRSSMIAEYIGYQGPITGWYDHFAKYYAKINSTQCHNFSSETFSPNINRVYRSNEGWHSVDDLSYGSADGEKVQMTAFDRLFDDSFTRLERKKELQDRKMSEELTDQTTSRPFFSPTCLSKPRRSLSNDVTPEETSTRLHGLHAERVKNREDFLSKDECSFAPKLNPKSMELSERRRKPLYHIKKVYSADDSPSGPNFHTPQKVWELDGISNGEIKNLHGVGASGQCSDGKASGKRKVNTNAHEDFLKRIERSNAIKKDKLLKMRQETEAYETKDCTFKPLVNRRSMELFFQLNQNGNDFKMNSPIQNFREGHNTNSSLHPTLEPSVNHIGGSAVNPNSPTPYFTSNPIDNCISSSLLPNRMPSSISRSGLSTQPYSTSNGGNIAELGNYHTAQVAHNEATGHFDHMSLHSSASGPGDVDNYVNNFEKEMLSVLDEWKKLDDDFVH